MNFSFKSLLAALILLCSTVATARNFEVGGIFYNITSSTEKTVEVTSKGDFDDDYNEYTGDVTVPSTVAYNGNTYSVTSIGKGAFNGCSGLTSIEIPGSVTSIGQWAFKYCRGLTSITIPNSVKSIEWGTFEDCTGLTSITIPNSVTSIGEYAFYGCTGLTSIEIPNSVTSIGPEAFENCKGLTSITIPNSVTSIGDAAFYQCSGLTSITIPNSVTSIEGYTFGGCTGLTSIEIPGSVTSIGNYAFGWCSGLTSIEIPGSVTSIGDRVFFYCSCLTRVTSLATTAPALGSAAFSDISSGATLYYPAGSDYSSWEQYFANTEEIEIAEPIYFGYNNGLPGSMQGNNHVWESGKISFSSATNGIRITVFATNSQDSYNGFPMVALGELEFYNANGEKIDYTAADATTNSLESSEGSLEGLCDGDYSTFYHSTWRSGTNPSDYVYVDVRFAQPLDAVNIKIVGRNTGRLVPTHIGITSSGVYCPYLGTEGSCGDNVRWSLENCVLTISGTGAMWDYSNYNNIAPWSSDEISRVVIEDGVTSIGKYAFYDCSGLTSIEIPGSVTSIGDYAFRDCSGLTSVTIGDGVTSIGESAFYECGRLTSIEIPGSVTSIGYMAFHGCSGLTSIEIPGSVTSIGEYAFSSCSGLKSVTIGDGVTSIGGHAFSNCYGLTSIEIHGSVTSIGRSPFSNCSGLTSILVAEENTVYDSRNNCNAIIETATNTLIQGCQNTIIPGSITSIGDWAFYYCYRLTSIEIPGSVTSIGEYAFSDCDGLTSIEIPGSVTSIGGSAFGYCRGLTSVTIGDGVTSIGGSAFEGCSGLTSVTSLATTAPGLGSGVFTGISSDATLYYPAGSDYSSWAQYFAKMEEITEEFPEEEEVFGDLNGDGTVSVSDIQVLVNLILSDAAAEDNPAADVNSDGTVSVSDIQVLVNRILGKY